jgi:predicted protein tyrosine phosphatase
VSAIPEIVIASFERAENMLRRPDHDGIRSVVSIGEVGSSPPAEFRWLPLRKLRLEFADVTKSAHEKMLLGGKRATRAQVDELVEFLRGVDGKILFHCAAGVSRSAAAACIFVAMRMGPGKERQALEYVRMVKQTIHPNKHVLRLADEALGLGGALLGAAFDLWHEPVDVLA